MNWKEALNSGLGKSLGLQLVSRETLARIRAREQAQAKLARGARRTKHLTTPTPDPVNGQGEANAVHERLPADYEPEFAEIWNRVKHRTMTGHAKGYYLHRAVCYVIAQQIPGAIVECGVWRGGSMLNVAHTLARLGVSDRELYLFDTFSGMSEPTDRDVHMAFNRLVDLDALREVVGSREHRAAADDIARRAVTLLRDNGSLLPVTGRRIAVVQYMPETELRAGKIFGAELRSAFPGTRVMKISPATSAADLDSVARQVAGADRVVVAAYVRRIEGEGRPAVPLHIARWIDTLARREKVVAVALGNPYLIRQFPNVSTYLVTYGVGDALERAAAAVVLGRTSATGTAPVSLPGFFKRGDGIRR